MPGRISGSRPPSSPGSPPCARRASRSLTKAMTAPTTRSTTTPRPSATTRKPPSWRGAGPSASSSDTWHKKRAGGSLRRPFLLPLSRRLFAVAHEAEQELEHVDEVEIEAQRPHDHGPAHH